jgi:hypothetical protein
MEPYIRPSKRASVLGFVAPQSSASGAKVTGWLDATTFHNVLAVIQTGAMTATGTLDAKFQQATSNAGAGAKDVTGKAITQLLAASNSNNQVLIDMRQEDLDIANGFKWIQLSITPATAASLLAGVVLGFDPRNLEASNSLNANASQVQVV